LLQGLIVVSRQRVAAGEQILESTDNQCHLGSLAHVQGLSW
jgi:hypothetical protein